MTGCGLTREDNFAKISFIIRANVYKFLIYTGKRQLDFITVNLFKITSKITLKNKGFWG